MIIICKVTLPKSQTNYLQCTALFNQWTLGPMIFPYHWSAHHIPLYSLSFIHCLLFTVIYSLSCIHCTSSSWARTTTGVLECALLQARLLHTACFTLYTAHCCTLHTTHCTLYTTHYTLHTVLSTLHYVAYNNMFVLFCVKHTAHCTLPSYQLQTTCCTPHISFFYTLHSSQCTLHTTHCILTSTHCTMHTSQYTLL